MKWFCAALVGLLCLGLCLQAESRHLSRDMDRYDRYDDSYADSYLDQLRDNSYEDSEENDDQDDYGDYSGEYDDDYGEDDDEDRDYREWLAEKNAYFQGKADRQMEPYQGQYYGDRYETRMKTGLGYPQRELPPKYEVYGRGYDIPESAAKNQETVADMSLKLNEMQNEIDNLRGMLGNKQLPYRPKYY